VKSKWTELAQYGQSVWYDNTARPALASGLLERLVRDDNVTGGTSNPSIFAKAVEGSDLYDEDIRSAGRALDDEEVFEKLAIADIRQACRLLRPVWDRTGGADGYISIEVEAALADDAEGTIRRAHALRMAVGEPNVMVKVPGTEAGVRATRQLVRDGVNVNVTLLFSVERYGEIAEAYLRGLEERLSDGNGIADITSVASFFVSRIDTKVDERLPEGSPLRGRIAVANAKRAYADVFKTAFSGERWERLAAAGGNLQRPLWASTGVKNPAYSPTVYIDELIGRHTVTTVPDATLDAFRENGTPGPDTIERGLDEARRQLGYYTLQTPPSEGG
jgi:transaldolase